MKKTANILILVAAAAMGFTACQKELREDIPAGENSVRVNFIATSPETKTSVDTSGDAPLFAWGDNETFAVLEQTDALAAATSVTYEKVDGKANITAEFAANPGKESYDYVTIYPADGYVSATGLANATLSLPAVQTMASASYDPAADLMVSEVVSVNAQPAEAQMVRFTRLAAVVKMSLKGLGLEAGDQVEQVIFTAEGKSLAGTVTADLADPHGFTVAEGVDNVSVNTTSSSDVYFTVLPATLEAGDAYTITVLTGKKIYIKKGTVPEGKSLVFEAGMVTRFGVDIKGVVPSDKWVLVKDASTLKEGDVVTVAAKNYNYVVGYQANNYPIASEIEVVKFGDYLYHPVASSATTRTNRIQYYTLLKRDRNRIAFDFYNGVDYDGDSEVGFVFASGTNYSPKLQSWCDKNTLFDVEITDGVATLEASEIEKSYKWWRYSHSTSAGSRKFDCTNSVPTGNYQICLYKLEGAVGTIPVVEANVTVPDADESVVIAEEGAAEATAITEVVFNYVGDWTITPSTDAQWLNVTYDAAKNCLTYTADANVDAKRETTVTINATLKGQESLSWTFNVTQKGAPQEISIEEFMTKGQDVNVTYKITGRITEMTSSSSGTYKLTDGTNVATITYLYTDGGDKVYGDDTIGLEVGDVVTVTTVVASSTKGKGGSSSYHSIYKGHYGLKASAGLAAEYTGGTVAIDVTTKNNGNIVLPEAVTAVMTENSFAEFAYDGGSQATVTFATENTTSDAREAEVTFTYGQTSVVVTVQQGVNPANKKGYELVTDASQLAIGDEVIIVAKNADKALACPTKTSDTKFPSTNIEKTGNVIYDIEDAGVQTFILESGLTEETMAFKFTYKESTYYPYYSSGLKMRTSINDQASWTMLINEDGGALISTVSSSKDYLIKYNSASSSFTAYLSTASNATKAENAICIYKKQK